MARSAAGMLGVPSVTGGSSGSGNVTHGPVTNNFYITSTDPKAAAQEVANLIWGQAGQARQMQVGM